MAGENLRIVNLSRGTGVCLLYICPFFASKFMGVFEFGDVCGLFYIGGYTCFYVITPVRERNCFHFEIKGLHFPSWCPCKGLPSPQTQTSEH